MSRVLTTFTTANIRAGLPPKATLLALAEALRGTEDGRTDVLATQEMNDRQLQNLLDALEPGVWATHQDRSKRAKARCAIAWRRGRFRRIRVWTVLMSLSRLFPSATRYFAAALLYDRKTGRRWLVVDLHFVPHADDDRGNVTRYPRRRLVIQGLDAVVRFFLLAPWGQRVALGDLNVDLRDDLKHTDPQAPVERFASIGMTSSAAVLGVPADTHGRNLYDQAFFRLRPKAFRLISQRVHRKTPSDHRAYSVTAAVTVRKRRLRAA